MVIRASRCAKFLETRLSTRLAFSGVRTKKESCEGRIGRRDIQA